MVVCGAIGFALNFIFTPEKLTSTTNAILKEYVSEDASIQKAELTFFSTFPNFSAEIDSLCIKQQVDSIPNFISADRCIVTVNAFAFLFKKEVVINNLLLEKPQIYIYADNNISSLDIIKILDETTDTEEESASDINIK